MTVTITTLSENSVPQGAGGLIGEHGQSFMVERGDCRLLFDTGQGLALIHNAGTLGMDLKTVQAVVLSHGHDDHSGGLQALLGVHPAFSLIAHPDVFSRKYVLSGEKMLFRGIRMDAETLAQGGVQLKLESGPVHIAAGIQTTGEIPMVNPFEAVGPEFFKQSNGEMEPDGLPDDQALVLTTEKGTVVLLGCTHRGLINTLTHVKALTGKSEIYAVIGGLHMGKASHEGIGVMIDQMRPFNIQTICVGHCTGMTAIRALFDAFPGRVSLNAVGNVLKY